MTEKDELNHTNTYTYNSFNKATNVNNAKNENTSFTYDNNGNVLTKTDGKGNVTTFTYNACDKVKTATDGTVISDPDRTESYTYLANGLLSTKLDKNGKTTTFAYDCHVRMLSQTSGSSVISYTFDNNGNQLTLVDSTGTTTRTYDELGRTKTKVVSNISGTSTFTYDEKNTPNDGCYAETTTDVKNNVTRKLFDKVGRLIKVTADSKDTLYTYDDAGNQLTVTISGVSSETYTYDLNSKILSVTNKKADNSAIDSYVYTYDFAGNQVSKVETSIETNGGLPVSTSFQFDELNRLKKVINPDNKTIDYTFDVAGNRLCETKATSGVTTETTSYMYNDQNRLLSTETITASTGNSLKKVYSYDNNGNMVYNTTEEAIVYEDSKTISIGFLKLGIETDTLSSKATLLTYDDFNHLIKAVAGTQTYSYTYNGENRQIAKTNGTNVIKYLYEGDRVILETNAAGTEIGRHVYGNSIIERKEGSVAAYYLFNGNNDVVKLVDGSGASIYSYSYDSFGNKTALISEDLAYRASHSLPNLNNYIYSSGQTYDSSLGMYYGEEGLHDPTTDYTCTSQYFTPQEDGIYYGGSSATEWTTQPGEPYKYDVPYGEVSKAEEVVTSTSIPNTPVIPGAEILPDGITGTYTPNGPITPGPGQTITQDNPGSATVVEEAKGTGNVTLGAEAKGTDENKSITAEDTGTILLNAIANGGLVIDDNSSVNAGGEDISIYGNDDSNSTRSIASVIKDANGKVLIFKQVIYLNSSNGANLQGHTAIMLVTDDNKGIVYSFTADPSQTGTIILGNSVKGTLLKAVDKQGNYTYVDVNKYLTNGSGEISLEPLKEGDKIPVDTYDRYIIIPISNSQGQKMYKKAESLYKNCPDYNLYAFNCNHMAQTILSSAKLNFAPTSASAADEQLAYATIGNPLIRNEIKTLIIVGMYKKDREDYTIPNAAYHRGVYFAGKKGWTAGIAHITTEYNPFK